MEEAKDRGVIRFRVRVGRGALCWSLTSLLSSLLVQISAATATPITMGMTIDQQLLHLLRFSRERSLPGSCPSRVTARLSHGKPSGRGHASRRPIMGKGMTGVVRIG